MFVTGIVLAAGSSRRLGRPKQLLAYRGGTLLGATLLVARRCGFHQLVVTLGGSGGDVRAAVDLAGTDVVDNPEFTTGCGSSIRTALDVVDDRAQGLVVMLGDQPGVSPETVRRLAQEASGSALGICRYADGLGHPFWVGRAVFDDVRLLHGDKALWKLMESGRHAVTEVPAEGPIPLDVDTWEDYQLLLARDAGGLAMGASS